MYLSSKEIVINSDQCRFIPSPNSILSIVYSVYTQCSAMLAASLIGSGGQFFLNEAGWFKNFYNLDIKYNLKYHIKILILFLFLPERLLMKWIHKKNKRGRFNKHVCETEDCLCYPCSIHCRKIVYQGACAKHQRFSRWVLWETGQKWRKTLECSDFVHISVIHAQYSN